jgi:hypothetical protein
MSGLSGVLGGVGGFFDAFPSLVSCPKLGEAILCCRRSSWVMGEGVHGGQEPESGVEGVDNNVDSL